MIAGVMGIANDRAPGNPRPLESSGVIKLRRSAAPHSPIICRCIIETSQSGNERLEYDNYPSSFNRAGSTGFMASMTDSFLLLFLTDSLQKDDKKLEGKSPDLTFVY
jgi:hypothetical protein